MQTEAKTLSLSEGARVWVRGVSFYRPLGQENVSEYELTQKHPFRNEVSRFRTYSFHDAMAYVRLGWKLTPIPFPTSEPHETSTQTR